MSKAPKRPTLVAKTDDGTPMVEIYAMRTVDDTLIMDVKALGSMRMNVSVSTTNVAEGMEVIKASRKEIMAFAKQLPAALRKQKKLKKAQEQNKE